MASATEGPTRLSRNGRKWLVGVRDKLSRYAGFQLLKILYYEDSITERELDGAGDVFDVYTLSKESHNDGHSTAVALLYYRLSLLVPRSMHAPDGEEREDATLDPAKLLRAKDLGAKDCLDYFAKCGLSTPAEPSVSPEARLPECFVTAYVNLSPRKRRHFEEQLATVVGVYRRKQLDLFNLFCRLSHHEGNVADRFIEALNNAEVPSPVFDQLQHQLDAYNIQHDPIAEDTLKTKEETEEDYDYSETKPLLNINKHYHHGGCAHVCTKSRVACCLIPMVPLALLAIAVAASTVVVNNNQSESEVQMYETSRNLYDDLQCYTRDDLTAPIIHLGTISTQWSSGFLITQNLPEKYNYEYKNLDIYVVPSDKVIRHSRLFYCEDINMKVGVQLELTGVYFLRDTNMTFNVCIRSVEPMKDGWVDMAFYSTHSSYKSNNNHTLKYHRFLIGPNQTHCYQYSYTAQFDSFYYIRMGTVSHRSSDNVTVIYFRMNADMKYVNASDSWIKSSEKGACNCSSSFSDKECKFMFTKGSSLFAVKQQYDIFAQVTSPMFQYEFGHLSIQPLFRNESLALPTVVGVIILVPVELAILLCMLVTYCCVHKRKDRSRMLSNIVEDYGSIQ